MKRKLILGAMAALLLLAGALPFLNADPFKDRIHRAIEQSLERKVDISGNVRFSLFNGPGFSLGDVVIHEDPVAGIEPFAYVSSLNATLRLTSLLGGKWELSRIVLEEPTVNFVKHEGGWNIQPLLRQTTASVHRRIPEVRVRGGRLNFKIEDTKVVFYCANADVDLTPESDASLRVRFSVEPARTDRAAQGFGTLTGSGRYRWFSDKPSEVDLDLDLERSALADIATLFHGSGAEVSGFLATQAKFKGPLNALRIEGRLRLEDIQRFDLLRTGGGSWPIQYRGTLDFPAGEFSIRTRSARQPEPFRLRLRAQSLFTNPNWGTVVEFNELPVGALRDVFQYLNVDLPERGGLDGKLSGVLGYSRGRGLQGMVSMPEASLKLSGGVARISGAVMSVDGGQLRLRPAQLDLGQGVVAMVEGSYSASQETFQFRSGAGPLPLTAVVSSQKRILDVSEIPGLELFTEGSWQGAIQYARSADGVPVWSGGFNIRGAKMAVPGLALPVAVRTATGSLAGSRLSLDSLQGSVGDIDFRASLRAGSTATRPARLRIHVEELDAGELEKIFLPTLKRGTALLRTLSFRQQPVPDWLKNRHLDLQIEIKSLWSGDVWLGSLEGAGVWNGAKLEMPAVKWAREEASANAKIGILLARNEPQYRIEADVKNLAWMGGKLEGLLQMETAGTGLALLRNAKSTGKFVGRNLTFGGEAEVASMAGSFEFAGARTPSLKFTGVEVVAGSETFTGQGGSESDGRLAVEFSSASKRKLRMAGTMWPFQLDVAAR
jgi:hypothetical protein